jgi:uncharacterized Tic20 family protein
MTSNISQVSPQDERVLAALSHISVLLPLIGVMSPILIWVTQKEKSRYVAFQSLQALVYQLCIIITYFIGMACYACSFFSVFFGSSSELSQYIGPSSEYLFFIPFIFIGIIFLGGFIYIIYGIIGAIITFQGKPFRYFIIGKRVERFMQRK